MPKTAEIQLVTLLKQGDKAAFSTLYDNYSGSLYGIVMRIVNDEDLAQDVLQEAMIKVWKNIASYDDTKGTLFTWLLNVTRNLAIDKMRYNSKRQADPIDNVMHKADRAVSHNTEDTIGVKELVANLKPEFKSVIAMAYFNGYTQDEISKELNVPLGTVKTRTRNALLELRKILKA
ncbi:MAG: sigma-70 family RNA polymerase sigma factor [Bacteroidia bacterium]|nr:sigma-70 family RNA polymerase sigma factor [Bacteroidia bacterium]HQV01653.1 sigma-70 family RNA polymerase sigma factor [Bacteroidia bacterium]